MADGLALIDVDDNVAFRTGPGRVRKPAGSVPCSAFQPPFDATLQCLKARAAINTFGLGNVRGWKGGSYSDPLSTNMILLKYYKHVP